VLLVSNGLITKNNREHQLLNIIINEDIKNKLFGIGYSLDFNGEIFIDIVRQMFFYIHSYIKKQLKEVDYCYAYPSEGIIKIFFLIDNKQFDFDLADILFLFEKELKKKYNFNCIEIYQISLSSKENFIDEDNSVKIYGN